MGAGERSRSAGSASHGLLAALVVGAIVLLHVGLYLVLTRAARGDIESIEAAWSEADLAQASPPGPQPETTGPAYAAWARQQRLHEDAERLGERQEQVRMLRLGLGGSGLLQAGFVLWLTLRRYLRSGAARP